MSAKLTTKHCCNKKILRISNMKEMNYVFFVFSLPFCKWQRSCVGGIINEVCVSFIMYGLADV